MENNNDQVVVEVSEKKKNKTLIVVDMQNDFITGSLGTEEAQKILPNVVEKVNKYKENGDRIIFTQDTHDQWEYPMTQEGRKLPTLHCIRKTEGHKIHEDLHAEDVATAIMVKDKFAFTGWMMYTDEDMGDIEVVGLCTDICVISNVLLLKALYPENEITVDSNCCAGSTPERNLAALEVMKSCQVNVI